MNPPRIEACYFEAVSSASWLRLARVLEYSAGKACPGWTVHVDRITPAPIQANARSTFIQNTQKLDHWARLVSGAPEGTRLVLMDVDIMVLRSLDDVWARDFDFAYTTKTARLPFNAGVVFLRVTDPVRAFVTEWAAENQRLLRQNPNKASSHGWRQQYGGINQGALAHTLGTLGSTLRVDTLPCAEWNCEDSSWATYDQAVTRIVHVKGALRSACLSREPANGPLATLVEKWRALSLDAARESRVA